MLALFKGAHGAWTSSCAARRAWWQAMDGDVLDEEVDRRELQLHRRRRKAAAKAYDRQMAQKAAKRVRRAHLRQIAQAGGMSLPELLRRRPDARDAVPSDLAAMVPAPAHRGWGGSLRSHPRSKRKSLCDDYVGDRPPPRRRVRRREREAVVRRFGQ